ncbi:VanZ family protein [Priestia megaterium]|uniref:VanZ family protein n=1 Tax=Priestia megaterium TaxID=1404 RepID=UPI00366CC7EB
MLKRNSINVLFLVSILLVIRLTMFPESSLGIGEGKGGINLVPFYTMRDLLFHHSFGDFILNNIGNIVLFLPLGFFLPIRFRQIDNLPKSFLVGMLLSTSIEIVQLFMPNRWTDIDDVLLNTLGTGVGYSLFKALNKIEIYMKEG